MYYRIPNVKSLTRELKRGGKLGERHGYGKGRCTRPGYNVRFGFRVPFVAKEGEMNGGGGGATTHPSNEIFLSDLMLGWAQAAW